MDGHRFDLWIKQATGSRRSTLRTLIASLVTGFALAVPERAAAAPCKNVGQTCEKQADCCRGGECKRGKCACKRKATTCGKDCCGEDEQCLKGGDGAGTCCAAGKVCGKKCCPPNRVCLCQNPPDIPGVPHPDPDELCRCVCKPGWREDATGKCVCDAPCGQSDCCSEADGEKCCWLDRVGHDAICYNVKTSMNHCGYCGVRCDRRSERCVDGKCVCAFGYRLCDGTCIPTAEDWCCSDADCNDGGFCCRSVDGPTLCGPGGCGSALFTCVECI
jgi:hypothetical protein